MFAPLNEHRFSFVPAYLFPLAIAVFPPLLFAATYPLTYAEVPKTDNKVIFLSSTIDYPPMSCIGSLGLMFGSILLLICSFLIFMRNKKLVSSGDMRSRKLNKVALALAVISAVGCSGVAAFQQHLYIIVHLVFAGMFFIFGVAYINVVAHMERWRDEHTLSCKIRRVIAIMSIIVGASGERALRFVSLALLLIIHAGIAAVQVMNYKLGHEYKNLISQVGAGVEIFVFLSLLAFFSTFVFEFKTISLDFQITRRRESSSGQSDTAANSASSSHSDFSNRR
jgi:hypothetical protein